MSMNDKLSNDIAGSDGWHEHEISQLRQFRALSLREKMEAVQGMADVVRRFQQMRREGSFHVAPQAYESRGEREAEVAREAPTHYRPDSAADEVALPGCTPEPLMAYLKALGILRLVSEQKDKEARGWWKNGVFWIRSPVLFKDAATEEAKRDALVRFLLEEYQPTPIVAPWAGGSGFFKKDNKKAVEELSKSRAPRTDLYAKTIQLVSRIIKEENVGDKPKDDDKVRLIRRYRRELYNEVVGWMDAAMVLGQDGQDFSPLLGTGGNDGRLDFTQNFMQRIVSLGLHKSSPIDNKSHELLNQALFLALATLDKASVGQFAPGRAGGPNATQGMEGDSTDNTWEFILMMEGTLLLAGAAAQRFGDVNNSRPSFPFTVRSVASGFDSAAEKDEAESRGEVWLPLWARPTSAGELRQLFGEGRAEVLGRPARDGTDFARAVAGLGVDRGIVRFNRIGFLKRSGKAFLAFRLGQFEVVGRSEVDLLREIDRWLDEFRWKCARGRDKEEAPKRILSTLTGIDSSIFEYCKYGEPRLFQKIVIALGRAERELAVTQGQFKRKTVKPISLLSSAWMHAADDRSPEFAVARALVSVHDQEGKIGPFKSNLEPVDWKQRCRAWTEKNRAVVWNARGLYTNLASVLYRRMMDGQGVGCNRLPLASTYSASLDAVARFLDGDLDEQRIEDLIWGLMLIEHRDIQITGVYKEPDLPMSRTYALLKLLFLSRSIVPDRATGKPCWRLARNGEVGITIRPERRILSLLQAGRVGEACSIATQRLRVSGLTPMPGKLPDGKTRDNPWFEYADNHRVAQRLAAALLIPVGSHDVNHLIHLVCRNEQALALM